MTIKINIQALTLKGSLKSISFVSLSPRGIMGMAGSRLRTHRETTS